MFAKKFIFSKFSGLETYSRQLYYQMNSFTSIFQQHFKPPPHAPPFIDLSPPPPHPHQILKSPPSPPPTNGKDTAPHMFSTPVGNPALRFWTLTFSFISCGAIIFTSTCYNVPSCLLPTSH